MREKTIVLIGCGILVLLLLCGVMTIFISRLWNQGSNDINDTSDNPNTSSDTTTTDDDQTLEIFDQLVSSQETYAATLLINKEGYDTESRLLDLMTPLGPLDPIATDDGNTDARNAYISMFGYYSAMINLPEETMTFLVQLPLEYATESFDYEEYYEINKEALDEIDSDVLSFENVNIIANWTSGLVRVNNSFADHDQNLAWKLENHGGDFYDFANVQFIQITELETLETRMQQMPDMEDQDIDGLAMVIGKMAQVNITTIYKCSGNTIYIMGATTDNAFGFIRNTQIQDTQTSNDINCGLLNNRFEIIIDEELEDGWRFWVGR